jgi:cytochrome c
MSSPHRPKSPSSFVTCTTLAALMCVTHLAIAQDSNDVAIGKSLYEAKCSACHSVDANRTGPLHRGVVGRPVASVPGFTYSPALQRLGGVWTPERLDLWLQNPQALASGSTMYFTVDDPVQRRQIIAYLGTLLSPAHPGK